MPTLILSPMMSSDSRRLRVAAQGIGWKTFRLESWDSAVEEARREAVVWGELRLGRVVATALRLGLMGPTVGWLPDLPERYRSRSVALRRLGEVRSVSERVFVKPVYEKTFPAQVYEGGGLGEAVRDVGDELLVQVAEPVTFEVEYRCFVAERKVVAMAPYLRKGRPTVSKGGEWPRTGEEASLAAEFAGQVLGDPKVAVPPGVVLDVGMLEGGVWAVVEANEAWAAGIYGCEAEGVLRVLRRVCVPMEDVASAERAWVHEFGSKPE